MRQRKGRKGNAIIEFTLVAIPLIFIQISIVEICRGMWDYHSLTQAVKAASRAAATRGAGCAGTGCAMTVGQVATTISGYAIGMPASALNVTLTSNAGNVTCNPLSTCTGNNTVWPPGGRQYGGIGHHHLRIVQFQFDVDDVCAWHQWHAVFRGDVYREIPASTSVSICGNRLARDADKRP